MSVQLAPNARGVGADSAGAAAPRPARLTLRIGGMKCTHCPPLIEQAIKNVDGVTSAQVRTGCAFTMS